jgi:hypothetical protein
VRLNIEVDVDLNVEIACPLNFAIDVDVNIVEIEWRRIDMSSFARVYRK